MEYHKMTKPQIKEYNCATGEEIIRDATDAEIKQFAKDAVNAETRKAKAEAKAIAKAALLSKLGITAEEAVLLLS
jgi:hypothetical protein